jgi:palmitoyltransferase
MPYSSQYQFYYHLEHGPLMPKEAAWFNTLVACIWWSYERACRVDLGRLPQSLREGGARDGVETEKIADASAKEHHVGNWCKKCATMKPPRAHNCSQCKR